MENQIVPWERGRHRTQPVPLETAGAIGKVEAPVRQTGVADEHQRKGDAPAHRVANDVLGLVGREAGAGDDGTGLEPSGLPGEPREHEGPGGNPGHADRDGNDRKQNQERSHGSNEA